MEPISVLEADKIIREWARGYGDEDVHFEKALGRVLAEKLTADRALQSEDHSSAQASDIVAHKGQLVGATVVQAAVSLGRTAIKVQKLPRVAVITTGDERVQRSNGAMIQAALSYFGLTVESLHVPDEQLKSEVSRCLGAYDVILTSGGISGEAHDLLPKVFEERGVRKLFYTVKQEPGRPFWFGRHDEGAIVFAFPGDPVSAFLCLNRYFIPWLRLGLGLEYRPIEYAVLSKDVFFEPPLQLFLPVELSTDETGVLTALPLENDAGGISTLTQTDAFLELPMEKRKFKKGRAFRIARYVGFSSVSDFRPEAQPLRVKFFLPSV